MHDLPAIQPRTLGDVLVANAARHPDKPQHYKVTPAGWAPVTWREVITTVDELAAALWCRGVTQGERVAILSDTRPEWSFVDQAAYALGAVVVGIYPTSAARDVEYILAHSGATVLFLDRAARLSELGVGAEGLGRVRWTCTFDGEALARPDATTLDALRAQGREVLRRDPGVVAAQRAAVPADAIATVVYTSGTTGVPKGVVITHENLLAVTASAIDVLQLSEADVGVIALPLAHVLQRVSTYSGMRAGAHAWYAPSLERLGETWQAGHPTVISVVPRILEKVQARILAGVEAAPPRRRRLARWALAVGAAGLRRRRAGAAPGLGERLRLRLAGRILRRIRARVFGERLRYLVSGGAPLRRDVHDFFAGLGIEVLEGYGLTETTAAVAVNRIGAGRPGTVGRAMPGVELRLADDGEVLVRGAGTFREYYRDAAATAESHTQDGWFRTGDLGELGADGFLCITGRKKELIITAGGKNIAPSRLEEALCRDPRVGHAVVIGDDRPYLTALLFPDPEHVAAPGAPDLAEAAPQLVDAVNAGLARYESIKRVRVVPEPLAVASGLLTPTLKPRRAAIAARYADLIDELYDEPLHAAAAPAAPLTEKSRGADFRA